jgi:2'-hydroxyisoflavone reductase
MVNGEKAVAAGLNTRPVLETARDALAWWKTLPEERTSVPRAGLDPAKEAEALALWKAQES